MSKRTIRMIDLMCNVANWNGCIGTATKWPNRAEAEIDIRSWTKKRDHRLTRLKAIAAALTPEELELIRRRYRLDLRERLHEIGVHEIGGERVAEA